MDHILAFQEHSLPSLPYEYDALEPHIDKETMILHHTKHHQTYTDKMNKALSEIKQSYQGDESITLDYLLRCIAREDAGMCEKASLWKDESVRKLLRNNGGGFSKF